MFCRSSFVLFVFYCLSFFDLRFGMFSKIFISDLCYCVSKGFDLLFILFFSDFFACDVESIQVGLISHFAFITVVST
jgi:hypothetical protein